MMLMQIPIYDSHFFIGFPVLLWLAYDSYRRYRKNQNVSTLYLAYASLWMSITMFCFGFPALFTSNPRILSLFTFIGDCMLASALLFMWLLSIRAFLSNKPKTMFVANCVVIALAIGSFVDSFVRNLRLPYSTNLVAVTSNTSDIIFAGSLRYSILVGINSISLFLLSFYFWKQGNGAPNSGQRLRIRALSITFLFASLVLIAMPSIPLSNNFELRDLILSTVFILIGGSAIIGSLLNKPSTTN